MQTKVIVNKLIVAKFLIGSFNKIDGISHGVKLKAVGRVAIEPR